MTRLKQVTIEPELEVSGLAFNSDEIDHEETKDPSRRMRPDGVFIEILGDYSMRFTIPESLHPGGLTIVLKDPTQVDLEFVAEFSKGRPEKMPEMIKRLVCRLCTQWGDRPGVTVPIYEKVRSKLAQVIIQEVSAFL
jgi:hypothetical protein